MKKKNMNMDENFVLDIFADTKYAFISMIKCGSGNFEVILQNEEENNRDFQIVLTGQITLLPEDVAASDQKFSVSDTTQISSTTSRPTQFYDAYKHAGYHLGENFVLVNELYQNNSGL